MDGFEGTKRRSGVSVGRREVLATAGGLTAAGLAGCLGGGSGDRPTPEQQLPTPVAGDPEAAVTVASFEDFACPGCATYSLQYRPRIWSEYVQPERIRYEWYDFPLPKDDRHSWLAADAARSVQANADDVTAFWEFEQAVFRNQDSLSLDLYERLATDLGLDGATVRQETEDRTYEPTVVASRQTGEERSVDATPTVFVDDERFEGPSLQELLDAIDAALASA